LRQHCVGTAQVGINYAPDWWITCSHIEAAAVQLCFFKPDACSERDISSKRTVAFFSCSYLVSVTYRTKPTWNKIGSALKCEMAIRSRNHCCNGNATMSSVYCWATCHCQQ
jgi:hypothetical protein